VKRSLELLVVAGIAIADQTSEERLRRSVVVLATLNSSEGKTHG